jgi:hypothetical protein
MVAELTAHELDAALAILRKHGVASAEVPCSDDGVVVLRVVFAPDAPGPTPTGDELTPGGWKSPQRLDADPLDGERSVP